MEENWFLQKHSPQDIANAITLVISHVFHFLQPNEMHDVFQVCFLFIYLFIYLFILFIYFILFYLLFYFILFLFLMILPPPFLSPSLSPPFLPKNQTGYNNNRGQKEKKNHHISTS